MRLMFMACHSPGSLAFAGCRPPSGSFHTLDAERSDYSPKISIFSRTAPPEHPQCPPWLVRWSLLLSGNQGCLPKSFADC